MYIYDHHWIIPGRTHPPCFSYDKTGPFFYLREGFASHQSTLDAPFHIATLSFPPQQTHLPLSTTPITTTAMSSSERDQPIYNPLGSPTRHVTTHSPTTGLSIFAPPSLLPSSPTPYGSVGMVVHDLYKTFTTPLNMSTEDDINRLQAHPLQPSPGTLWFPKAPGETLVRYCDWGPGQAIQFHRTETIDFGVVIEGEMVLTLDGLEKRRLKKGDVVVQRGTMHAWENKSDTAWARVVFFLVGAEAVDVGGNKKTEELPWSHA
ncbi:Putative Cupin domain protein [Podospora comata]|uniref:Cupin domain protein n=1 Tax=Podospora comata TaxID=48703 RepID=A0ABY6SIK4_PODCO|nr:Putative Cupin domain protein [Podospora comata]